MAALPAHPGFGGIGLIKYPSQRRMNYHLFYLSKAVLVKDDTCQRQQNQL